MKYKAIIFDLDGTLLNTIDDLCDSMNYTLTKFGYPAISVAQAMSYVGKGSEVFLEKALPKGTKNPDFDECLVVYKEHYEKNMSNKTRPYDGISDMLKKLKEQEYKTAIVSNKFHDAVIKISPEYFNGFIDTAIGESETVAKKPAPDSVYAALNILKCEKKDAVYVGDSDTDAKTSKNAGMDFIGVSWGFRDKQLLYDLGAMTVIDKPDDIFQFIE